MHQKLITHFVCDEMFKKYGDKAKCCGCEGHSCDDKEHTDLPQDIWEELGGNWSRICSNETTLRNWIQKHFVERSELREKVEKMMDNTVKDYEDILRLRLYDRPKSSPTP